MKDFTKVINPGKDIDGNIFCKIEYSNNRLRISGVVSPTSNSNYRGSCGQIMDNLLNCKPGKDWDYEKIEMLYDIWNQYHLNDMLAGSPNQRACLAMHKLGNPGERVDYDTALEILGNAGIQPDPDYLHNEKPYKYGTAWLSIDIPEPILKWLYNLPETTIIPVWV